MKNDPLGPEVFDVIYQRVCDWRRLGHLLGLENDVLNNIETDYAKKEDRVERCILLKKESEANPLEWSYLKDILLIMDEKDLVIDIEGKPAELLQDARIDKSDVDPLCPGIFDMIYQQVCNWRRLGHFIGLEDHELNNIELDNTKKEHRVESCISRKKEIVGNPIGWFYWRNILLKIKEIDLVDDIEEKYPDLLKDKRIDISNVAHQALEEFGILAHDASRTEHFQKLPIKLKDKIKVCVGGGREKIFQIKNMHTIQDNYFEKYKCVDHIKMYNFTNIGIRNECAVLRTLYEWLQKNEDDGFCIKGYDAKRHLEFITDDYEHKNPKESYILVYSKKHCCIFFIDTEPIEIKTSLRENRSNIRPIRSANQCLDDASFIFIPLTLHDPNKHKIDDSICKACIDLQLVVSTDTFKDLNLFEQWWEKFSNEVEGMKSELEDRPDDSNNFFRNIMTYMAFDSFLLPSFTINKENEIKEVQKLIMLTPEQQDIVYSINRHKIIKGPFGTGKTVVAQKILKLFANSPQDKEKTYYIMHDTQGFQYSILRLAT